MFDDPTPLLFEKPAKKKPRHYTFHISPERLHELRELRARTGKLSRGNGGGKPNFAPGEERVVFKMLKSTRDTLMKCARAEGVFSNDLLHAIAMSLREDPRYAHLFATSAPTPAGAEDKPDATAPVPSGRTPRTDIRIKKSDYVRLYTIAQQRGETMPKTMTWILSQVPSPPTPQTTQTTPERKEDEL